MARKLNLNIDQGASFQTDVIISDPDGNRLDMSGYTANAAVKTWFTSTDSVAFTANLVNAANGIITLAMNAATTSLLVRQRYIYDLIVTDPSSVVTRLVEGIILVDPMVTGSVE